MKIIDFDFQDDTYTESYISTIGVDFVRIDFCFRNKKKQNFLSENPNNRSRW